MPLPLLMNISCPRLQLATVANAAAEREDQLRSAVSVAGSAALAQAQDEIEILKKTQEASDLAGQRLR